MTKRLQLITESEANDIKYTADIAYWTLNPHIADNGDLMFGCVDSSPNRPSVYRLTTLQLQTAALALLCARDASNGALVNDAILASIATRDIDATAADCIVQFAAFGEIIYS